MRSGDEKTRTMHAACWVVGVGKHAFGKRQHRQKHYESRVHQALRELSRLDGLLLEISNLGTCRAPFSHEQKPDRARESGRKGWADKERKRFKAMPLGGLQGRG
jgi:hypothetical protein